MVLQFYDILKIIAAFQFLLVSIFLITHKQISNKIFATFLLSKALSIVDSLLFRFKEYIYVDFPHIFCIAGTFIFLYGPSLYFYTKSLAYRGFKFKKIHTFHLIPFISYWIFMTFRFHIHSTEIKRELLASTYFFNYYEALIVFGFLFIQILAYTIASLCVLQSYRSEIKKVFSSIDRINLSWLSFLLFGFIVIWLMEFSNFIILMTTGTSLLFLNIVSLMSIFIFANAIVYRGLRQPKIFSGIEKRPKYEKSSLTKSDSERYLKDLIAYMEIKKPYLTPSLTLNDLAEKLSIPARYLSQVINESLNQNFFDFINSYRIEEAKRYLMDHSNSKKTILEVLYEVGFNAKSTFNSVFKKHTGMTPSEFKKLHSNPKFGKRP